MRKVVKGLIWLALIALTVGGALRAATPAIAAVLGDRDESRIKVKKYVSRNGNDWKDADEAEHAVRIELGDAVWWKIMIKSEIRAPMTLVDELDGETVTLNPGCPKLPDTQNSDDATRLESRTTYTCVYSSTTSLEGLHHNVVKVTATLKDEVVGGEDGAFYRVEAGQKGEEESAGDKRSEDDEKGEGEQEDDDELSEDEKEGDDREHHGDDRQIEIVEVEVEKWVSAIGPNRFKWEKADEREEAVLVAPGATVWWKIEVMFKSNGPLTLDITDKLDGAPVALRANCPRFLDSDTLESGTVYTCVYSSVAKPAGIHHNAVKVIATAQDKEVVAATAAQRKKKDIDRAWAFYRVRTDRKDGDDKDEERKHHDRIEIDVEKSISLDETDANGWQEADSWHEALEVPLGSKVSWKIEVTNRKLFAVNLVLFDRFDGEPLALPPNCQQEESPFISLGPEVTDISLGPGATYTCVFSSEVTTEGVHFNSVKVVAFPSKGSMMIGRGVGGDAAFYRAVAAGQEDGQKDRPKGTANFRFWRKYPRLWPIVHIIIGRLPYDKWEAIDLIGDEDEEELSVAAVADVTYRMFSAVAAAKLNVADRNDASCITQVIDLADAWLANNVVGSGVGESDPAWQEGLPLYNTLTDYNNGKLCAPARIASTNQFLFLPAVSVK